MHSTVRLLRTMVALSLSFSTVADAAARLTTSRAADSTCLTQKMLISCYQSQKTFASLLGAIHCGSTSAASVSLATEVLLDWHHNVSQSEQLASPRIARLSIELSKLPSGLSLVLLDLTGTQLCTAATSGAHLQISFPAYPGFTRLAIRGLSLPGVSRATLRGGLLINADLLNGLPNLERLAVSDNNLTMTPDEPLASYSISTAGQLLAIQLLASIHSAAYATPLLASLPSLQSASISRGDMLLLRTGSFVGLPALRNLHLSQNNIMRLESGSLTGLNSLQHLDLNLNGLTRLDSRIFADLTSLRRLSLTRNRISNIDDNAFNGLTQLTELDLSYNQLARLSESVFTQLHSLQTLKLDINDLNSWTANDTFCPLQSLKVLWTDAPPFDCTRFGSEQMNQHVRQSGEFSRSRIYSCDIGKLPVERRPCHRWLDRISSQLSTGEAKERSAIAKADDNQQSQQRQQQPNQLTIILLIVFSIVCLIHVLTTGVTIYVCRRMRRQNGSGGRAGVGGRSHLGSDGRPRKWNGSSRRVPSLTTPLEEDEDAGRSLKAAGGGGGGVGGDGLLLSFQPGCGAGASGTSAALPPSSSGNGARPVKQNACAGHNLTKSSSGNNINKLTVREKSYDFNEDEPRS